MGIRIFRDGDLDVGWGLGQGCVGNTKGNTEIETSSGGS